MNKLFKRSLVVILVILSMITALCVVASAAGEMPADTVASATVNGETKYYSDFKELVYEANGAGSNGNRWQTYEITLYADVEMDTALVVGNTATIKAAPGITPTIKANVTKPIFKTSGTQYYGAFVTASATNKIEINGVNVVIETANEKGALVMLNSTTESVALADGKKCELIFENVSVTSSKSMISQYTPAGGEKGRYEVTVKGGTWSAADGLGDFIYVPGSSVAEKLAFKLSITNATINAATLYNGPSIETFSAIYGNDATANDFGYGFRVGDTANGKVGEVYFATKEDALAYAESGVKVYDITGSAPEEVKKPCEHTYTSAVTAPTCDAEGYTTYTCSKCENSYTDDKVAALGHNYEAATCLKKSTCTVCGAEKGELARHKYEMPTCTKKSTCSVCGAERGELAAHVDADNNSKCDNCDAAMSTNEGTTTTPATTPADDGEEKTGCKGTVGAAGIALIAALGSCAIFVEKKRK